MNEHQQNCGNNDEAGKVASSALSQQEFLALQAELELHEQAIAMGQETEKTDARIREIEAIMEASPWQLHSDDGCVPKNGKMAQNDQATIADQAFAEYDFGKGVEVTDTSGWEYSTPGFERSRKVFVEAEREDDGPAPRWTLTFTVHFNPADGSLVEAYARDDNGQIWGSLPSRKLVEKGKKTVYCIARTGDVGGADWFSTPEARSEAERFSGDVLFDLDVDAGLLPAEITKAADNMAYNEQWLEEGSDCRRVEEAGKLVEHPRPILDLSSVDDYQLTQELRRRGLAVSVWGLDDVSDMIDEDEVADSLGDDQLQQLKEAFIDVIVHGSGTTHKMEDILASRGNDHLNEVWDEAKGHLVAGCKR